MWGHLDRQANSKGKKYLSASINFAFDFTGGRVLIQLLPLHEEDFVFQFLPLFPHVPSNDTAGLPTLTPPCALCVPGSDGPSPLPCWPKSSPGPMPGACSWSSSPHTWIQGGSVCPTRSSHQLNCRKRGGRDVARSRSVTSSLFLLLSGIWLCGCTTICFYNLHTYSYQRKVEHM